MRRAFVPLILVLLALPLAAEDADPIASARRHFAHRDHGLAEGELLNRISEAPEDVEAMKLLAEVYLRVEKPGDARRILEKALAVAPEDPMVRAGLWEVALAEGGWTPEAHAAVRKEVDAFLAATGDNTSLWRLEAAYGGYNLLNAKPEKAAIRDRLLALAPDDPSELVEGDLFEAIIVERDVDKRVELIHKFTTLFPESGQVNYVREIMAWALKGDRERLVFEMEAVLAEDPDNRRVHAALGRWLLEVDPPDPTRALAHLERAAELLGEPEDIDRPALCSDEDWERIIVETRGRYCAWMAKAYFLTDAWMSWGDYHAQAVALEADGVDLWVTAGRAFEANNAVRLAVECYARALAAADSPDATKRLLDLLSPDKTLRQHVAMHLGPSPRFVDATGSGGLGKVRGGRIAMADVTGDDFPDLLVGGSRLFVNTGDGRFAPAPLPALPGARGGLFADLDNDGDLDLLVFRTGHPMVLENDGAGVFADRTPEVMKRRFPHLTEGAAVFDLDGDGLLDLYLANYERRPNPPYARGTPDHVWRNLGEFRFEDASSAVSGVSAEPMCGRGVATGDLDDDGDTDLFVANYRLDPDFLLMNDGGRLVNEARARGVEGECDEGYFGHGIGPAFGDLNGDGHLDIVVGNLAHPRYIGFSDVTRIFLSGGEVPGSRFRDVFRESGIRYEETHSNASLGDVDLDGDLDLYLTSIYVGRKSFLYLNDGAAKFRNVTWLAGVRADNGWGSAFGDVDQDGDLDLVVGSGSGVKLYRNAGPGGGFIGLTLRGGDGTNGSAIGARVTLSSTAFEIVREVSGGTGTGCQNDPSLRLGTGEREGPFTLTVRWPSGHTQRILSVEPGRIYRLAEGANLETIR